MPSSLTCSPRVALALMTGLLLGGQIPGAMAQQQQAPTRVQVVEIDQATLDKWLIVFADVAPVAGADPNLSEAKLKELLEKACAKAALADINRCLAVDEYLNALLSGASEDGKSFVDPIARARQDLAGLLADKRVPAKEKAEQKAGIEGFIAGLPEKIPPAHIGLLNKNAARILQIMSQLPDAGRGSGPGQPPPEATPPPAKKK